jgi:hypothetical protein
MTAEGFVELTHGGPLIVRLSSKVLTSSYFRGVLADVRNGSSEAELGRIFHNVARR